MLEMWESVEKIPFLLMCILDFAIFYNGLSRFSNFVNWNVKKFPIFRSDEENRNFSLFFSFCLDLSMRLYNCGYTFVIICHVFITSRKRFIC